MEEKIIVLGHKNPDTDSICSAIAYAELKTRIGIKNVLAGRAGNINPQTNFVLNYFNTKPPVFFSDLYPKLSDIMISDPIMVSDDTPVLEVIKKFQEKGVRFLPVVKNGETVGTLITINLAERYSSYVDPKSARVVCTALPNIARVTESKILTTAKHTGEKNFNVFVGAMSIESFKRTISGFEPSELIIVVGDRIEIIQAAIEKGVAIIIVTGGFNVESEVIEKAEERGVVIMVAPHDSATTAWLVRLSVSAGNLCSKDYVALSPMERVDTAKTILSTRNQKAIVIEDKNKKIKGVVTKGCFMKKSGIKLILMDHNEPSQTVDGADQVEIIEVVDHHRVSGFNTTLPISMIIQPVGSTCTIVAEQYQEHKQELTKNTGGLLLSGIISDTVAGRSPTTTERDMKALAWLEVVCGVNREKFAIEMFNASSILDQKNPKEIILNDFKEFNIVGKKVGVGQVEVVGFEIFFKIKDRILYELSKLKEDREFNLVALMVSDITHEITLLAVAGDPVLSEMLGLKIKEKNIFEMKGVLSRKKQVIPHLINVLGN